jgi:hypothetical protein
MTYNNMPTIVWAFVGSEERTCQGEASETKENALFRAP